MSGSLSNRVNVCFYEAEGHITDLDLHVVHFPGASPQGPPSAFPAAKTGANRIHSAGEPRSTCTPWGRDEGTIACNSLSRSPAGLRGPGDGAGVLLGVGEGDRKKSGKFLLMFLSQFCSGPALLTFFPCPVLCQPEGDAMAHRGVLAIPSPQPHGELLREQARGK